MKGKPPEIQEHFPSKSSYLGICIILLLVGICLLNLDVVSENFIQDIRLNDLGRKYDQIVEKIHEKTARIFEKTSRPSLTRRLPHAIIIGARKCGTRALLEFLKLNSAIRGARFEVHFFDQNSTYSRGMQWYLSKMPLSRPNQITIEKTPGYFTSSLAPERVFAMNSSVKLILLVRNPVTRAISDYTQVHYTKLAKNKPHMPFEELVFDKNTGNLNTDYKPVRNSLYVKHMRRWLLYFPLHRIHLVNGDKLIRDPLPELRQVEQFLGLKTEIDSSQLFFNSTKGFYCFKPRKDGEVKCLGDTKGRPHVDVDHRTRLRLSSLFLPYNEKFYDLVQRRFDWD